MAFYHIDLHRTKPPIQKGDILIHLLNTYARFLSPLFSMVGIVERISLRMQTFLKKPCNFIFHHRTDTIFRVNATNNRRIEETYFVVNVRCRNTRHHIISRAYVQHIYTDSTISQLRNQRVHTNVPTLVTAKLLSIGGSG